MQFVKNGPDIPGKLLQDHEDGKVVFFCGAGVSYPANLPLFSGLVDDLYSKTGETPNDIEKSAIDNWQYDTAIGLLEKRIGRERVRNEVDGILTPDYSAKRATQTHESLLTLSKSRSGKTKIVTTNFDRIFEHVISQKRLVLETYSAPLLPVPKNRWNGLVYLHGLITNPPTKDHLDHLVMSSGDFGIAYLTERWAARFVTELFRNYVICFVGYSINDPVLRYMMDALAADSLRGEAPIEAYAFGNYKKGEEEKQENEWKAKNVKPILYKNRTNHYYLHQTLKEWADLYRSGATGKEKIISDYAFSKPSTSTKQDDFVGRTLWAVSDLSGLPAKRFAYFDPLPSLDWLDVFDNKSFSYDDLQRFKVQPENKRDDALSYSLLKRPTPYTLSPKMSVVYTSDALSYVADDVMSHLACWLSRHLSNPKLLIWIFNNGEVLSNGFEWCIRKRLSEKSYPKSINSIWLIILSGRLKSARNMNFYTWIDDYKNFGMTPAMKIRLGEILKPCVTLRRAFYDSEIDPYNIPNDHERVKDIVDWDIVLSTDYPHSVLQDLKSNASWQRDLPSLLDISVRLLREALDLMSQLSGVDSKHDQSYIVHPSIQDHEQNKDYYDWTVLIDLVRDSWMAASTSNASYAKQVAEGWTDIHYPVFRRLQMFAFSSSDLFTAKQSIDLLLSDDGWWLWSSETEHEALILLETLYGKASERQRERIEVAMLMGPDRSIYRDDIEPEQLRGIMDREVWLRLVKYSSNYINISDRVRSRLIEIESAHPDWELSEDGREGFPYWTGSGDDWREYHKSPLKTKELVSWIREHPASDTWNADDWRERCIHDDRRAASALIYLANANEWHPDRWRVALQVWSDESHIEKSWRRLRNLLANTTDEVLSGIASSLGTWLMEVAKIVSDDLQLFFRLCNRVLEYFSVVPVESDEEDDDPVFRAINHPVGHVIQAVIKWWYRQELEDDQALPVGMRALLTKVVNRRVGTFRHGRVILAANVITLYRVDPDWAKRHLLPLFDWRTSRAEATATWEGFLWSPRLYRPLMEEVKHMFIDTAAHYADLGKHGGQYAAILTFSSLDRGETFTRKEVADATRSLPVEGLEQVVKSLLNALESSGEQRGEYWESHLSPYLRYIYPKSMDLVTPIISEYFARLCVEAREKFPDALQQSEAWIKGGAVNHPDYVLHKLNESDICSHFPNDALEFINIVIRDDIQWAPRELSDCLAKIRVNQPEVLDDQRYIRLDELARRRAVN